MATIYVDNKPHVVKDEENLLHACLSIGLDLPYFCYHPALHSVGACRQCAVKIFSDEHDTRGKIAMACMTPVSDGIRLSIDDPEARAFRAGVIEFLMANHPHDCPVCDEGGECHLQDMTVMTGHTYRAYRHAKRTHVNQYLGPFVNHEMNRCIACYRCVRFYRDYAGGTDLEVFAGHDAVFFGRHEEGALESEFSGNLVEVCPTGVFTDKLFRKRYARVWDIQTAPSVCMHCGLGCNIIPGERYGTLRRIRNRYNYDVNGYFLCDRGRFGYDYVNGPARLRKAVSRASKTTLPRQVSPDEAIELAAQALKAARGIIGIGSPRASLEANFALRCLVGKNRYCSGVSRRESELLDAALALMRSTSLRQASLREAAMADAVLILGEDLLNTAPMLALAVRQTRLRRGGDAATALRIPSWDDGSIRRALQNEKSPLFIVTTEPTKLDAEATGVFRAAPRDIARMGHLIAAAIGQSKPPSGAREHEYETSQRIAGALLASKNPLLVWGVSSRCREIIAAASAVATALAEKRAGAAMAAVLPESNSCGTALLGGMALKEAIASVAKSETDTLIIMENDLYARMHEKDAAELLGGARQVIVIDHSQNRTVSAATLTLPAATFAEGIGTVVSSEGRAQRYFKVFVPEGDIRESWRWLRDLLGALGMPEGSAWKNFDDLVSAIAASMQGFAAMKDLAPGAQFLLSGRKVPRLGGRYSGRTAMHAAAAVAEPAPVEDGDSPFAFTMEGADRGIPPSLNSRYSAPGWNSVQAVTKYQVEAGGALRGGESGRRLIEPPPTRVATAPDPVLPAPYAATKGEWLAFPLHHLYGSEELSMLSPEIAHRAPKPYVALGAYDATELNLAEGENADINAGMHLLTLPCRILTGVPVGLAGLPLGLPGIPRIDMPCRITIRKSGGRP
jgi:NADH-quinone oxidoreductase subunit G